MNPTDEEKKIDLHMHSTASDGSDSPTVLVKKILQAGLAAAALTDHDTVSGLPEFCNAAKGTGLQAVPGVELSTKLGGKEIHIVGLWIDPESRAFKNFLAARRKEREARNLAMVRKLQQAGYAITDDEILAEARGESVGRPHMARVLIAKGYFPCMKEAFAKCLKRGAPCYVPREHVSPMEGIRVIHESGGVAVWAHPILAANTRSAMRRILRTLVPAGLDALETRYSLYTEDGRQATKAMADEFHILESGGSDYHGMNQPGIELGTALNIPYSFLEKMALLRSKGI